MGLPPKFVDDEIAHMKEIYEQNFAMNENDRQNISVN